VVVDASVLVEALTLPGSHGRWAEDLVSRHPLAAPHLAPGEVAHALRRAVLRGNLDSAEADRAHARLLGLRLELFPYGPCAERAWELRHQLSMYDAWYVALAEALELPLATSDLRLARASGPRCEFVLPLEEA
jgi:predicted nucleic acid-binding protein